MLQPKIKTVKALPDYKLLLTFETQETKVFDVSPYISGEWYGKLRDIEYFGTVRVLGLTVSWRDGQDIAPHELYDNSISISTIEELYIK